MKSSASELGLSLSNVLSSSQPQRSHKKGSYVKKKKKKKNELEDIFFPESKPVLLVSMNVPLVKCDLPNKRDPRTPRSKRFRGVSCVKSRGDSVFLDAPKNTEISFLRVMCPQGTSRV